MVSNALKLCDINANKIKVMGWTLLRSLHNKLYTFEDVWKQIHSHKLLQFGEL
jgi:hypothetical protein